MIKTCTKLVTDLHIYRQASQNNVGLLDRQLDPDNEALRLRQEAARLHAQIAAGVDVAMPLHVTGLHGDNLYMFSSIGSFEPTSSQYVDESSDYRVCLMSVKSTYLSLLYYRMMMKVITTTDGTAATYHNFILRYGSQCCMYMS